MPSREEITMKIDDKEFLDALDLLKDMEKSIDDKYIKATLRRKVKPITTKMKQKSHSARIPQMIGATTAKSKTGSAFIKVGVVKNDATLFPKISSYGLSAILEYGTEERFRQAKRAGIVTGRIPTGKIPQRRYAFLRSSWDSQIRQVEQDTIDTIIKRIEKRT